MADRAKAKACFFPPFFLQSLRRKLPMLRTHANLSVAVTGHAPTAHPPPPVLLNQSTIINKLSLLFCDSSFVLVAVDATEQTSQITPFVSRFRQIYKSRGSPVIVFLFPNYIGCRSKEAGGHRLPSTGLGCQPTLAASPQFHPNFSGHPGPTRAGQGRAGQTNTTTPAPPPPTHWQSLIDC